MEVERAAVELEKALFSSAQCASILAWPTAVAALLAACCGGRAEKRLSLNRDAANGEGDTPRFNGRPTGSA